MRDKRLLRQAQLTGRFVRVDRQTSWGNPFVIGRDGTREEVLAKHRLWIADQHDLLDRLSELKDRILGCWCYPPDLCHAMTLAELADAI